jgi:hypothetical protein
MRACNFSRKEHFPWKTGDYQEQTTHYLMIGSVSVKVGPTVGFCDATREEQNALAERYEAHDFGGLGSLSR